jgi:hypothetical protein
MKYTVTSLLEKLWSLSLTITFLSYIDDYLQLAYIGAYAYESRRDDPRFGQLLRRVAVPNQFDQIETHLVNFDIRNHDTIQVIFQQSLCDLFSSIFGISQLIKR